LDEPIDTATLQTILTMLKGAGVHRFKLKDLYIEFEAPFDDDEPQHGTTSLVGFSAANSSDDDGDAEEDLMKVTGKAKPREGGYEQVFGGNLPRFKKASE
jgi:hypothetical protein